MPAEALNTKEPRVIRAGFPYFRGFSEFDGEGNHSGYMYEYLVEIARYNGWKYEFVYARTTEELIGLLKMLEEGSLDIIPGIVRNENTKKLYDFPEYNCGESFSTLVVLKNDSRFSESDLTTFDGMNVGALRSARNGQANLTEFSESNGFSLFIREYDSEDSMFAALEIGQIDAALGINLTLKPEVRTLVSFSSDPYYIAVAKNNKDILRLLNTALIKIKEQNIDFDARLFRKYFPQTFPDRFVMSEQEKSFISSLAPVRVVSGTHNIPVDYFNKNGVFSGITAGILAGISEKTGIQFEYVQAKNSAEAREMLKRGEADLVTGFYDEEAYRRLDGTIVSVPYFSVPLLLVQGKRSALSVDGGEHALPVAPGSSDENLLTPYGSSVSACLRAVRSGKLEYFYGDIFSVDYYRRYYGITDITTITLPESEKDMAFGIKNSAGAEFLSLFNRAIRFISNDEKQRIILKSLAEVQFDMTAQAFIRNNALFSLLILLFVCSLITATVFFYMQKKRKIEKLSAQRYRALSELSEEILFEYDFLKDSLTIPVKSAARLGLEPVVPHFYERYLAGDFSFSVHGKFWKNLLNSVSDGTECGVQEFQLFFPDKTSGWYEVISVAVKDENGRKLLCIGKLRNIDRERREKERLLNIARRDPLTGLYNKRAAEVFCREFFTEDAAAGLKKNGVFFLIDLDDFKRINDTWGHLYGDEVLVTIGRIIQTPFRPGDVVARIGGDEFIVFVKNLNNKDKIKEKAEIILTAFHTNLSVRGKTIPVSCSIGIALYPQAGKTYEELYAHADNALYRAKKSGKNRFCFFEAE